MPLLEDMSPIPDHWERAGIGRGLDTGRTADYLPEDDEVEVVRQTTAEPTKPGKPIFNAKAMLNFIALVRKVPVAEDVFGMTFALYDSPDAAEAVWTESWPPGEGDCQADPTDCVHVVSGTFQVMLGAMEDLDSTIFAGGGQLWLGVTVESDAELPRRPRRGPAPVLDDHRTGEEPHAPAEDRHAGRGPEVAEEPEQAPEDGGDEGPYRAERAGDDAQRTHVRNTRDGL